MQDKLVNGGCIGFMAINTISQANEVFQTVQIILTVVSALVVLAFNIWKWYKTAKKDGKISKEEVKELVDIVKDSVEETKDIIDKESK